MNALVVAPYGEIRDSLSSLISVIPEINIVSTTDSLDYAIDFVVDYCPVIAVLVFDVLDLDKLTKTKSMKKANPELKLVAILKEIDWIPDSISKSTLKTNMEIFDAVLPQYARAGTIRETISKMVSV